jgi:hypothetical protein
MVPAEYNTSNSLSIVMGVFIAAAMRFGYHGNVFTEPLPIYSRLFWFWYLSFQQTCHNIVYRFIICQKKNFYVLLPLFFYVFLNCHGEQTNIGNRSVYVYFDVMQTVICHNTESRSGYHMQKF